jgi:branched-subunit amino acid ABC-type transport system permease component
MSLGGFDLSPANLLIGVFTGFLYGLLAIGLVLVYRASRFINFAHVAIGIFAASIFSRLVAGQGLPYWLLFPIGILAGAAIAAAVEWGFVRRIADAPRVLGTVVTLGLAQFLIIFGLLVNRNNATGRPASSRTSRSVRSRSRRRTSPSSFWPRSCCWRSRSSFAAPATAWRFEPPPTTPTPPHSQVSPPAAW